MSYKPPTEMERLPEYLEFIQNCGFDIPEPFLSILKEKSENNLEKDIDKED